MKGLGFHYLKDKKLGKLDLKELMEKNYGCKKVEKISWFCNFFIFQDTAFTEIKRVAIF